MTTSLNGMRQHGYLMPIPRSPTIHMPEDPQEDIPAPYGYVTIICPDHDREALKAKFMHACNQRRWKHIQQAEVKAKK